MPKFLNAQQSKLFSSSNSNISELQTHEFVTESGMEKAGPHIYKVHRRLAPNTLQIEGSEPAAASTNQVPKLSEPKAETRAMSLPQIDVLKVGSAVLTN